MLRVRLLLALVAAALVVVPTAGARTPGVAVDVDLTASDGSRVAALFASVAANGRGFGTIVPLGRASAVGMNRPESVRVRRLPDGALRVGGGLGTNIEVRIGAARRVEASGTLGLDADASRAIGVTGSGVASSRPYRPRPGHTILVVGKPRGPLRVALERRYTLVRYDQARWSRSALLADPARLDRVAGILVGADVTRAQLRQLDGVRALYNSGRWIGATESPVALDPHMYPVAHAHLGRNGALVRHPTANLGEASRSYLQIREPRIARVRVGIARMGRDTIDPRVIRRAIRNGTDRVTAAVIAGESASGSRITALKGAGPRGRAGVGGTDGSPAVVQPSQQGLSYYAVPVNQNIQVVLTSTAAAAQWLEYPFYCGPSPNQPGVWFYSQPCPSQTQTQTIALEYSPIYTVSLATSSDTVESQNVTEMNALEVDAVSGIQGGLAAGSYDTATDVVLPTTWSTPWNIQYEQGPVQLATSFQESSLLFAMGYHSVVLGCAATCTGTEGGTPQIAEGASQPTQQVTQVGGDWSSGSGWESSTSSTSGWDISGNLGFFGNDPTAGIDGGYNSSVTTENSQSGSIDSSVSYTLSNWTTNGVQAGGPSPNTLQGTYSTYSATIPNAGGQAASAASSYDFTPFLPNAANPQTLVGSAGGLIATPAQYGGDGPGPNCGSGAGACEQGPLASPIAWGSGMNVVDYQQASMTVARMSGSNTGELVVGSMDTAVVDNLFFVDQVAWQGWPQGLYSTRFGPRVQTFVQLQIRDQGDVYAAQVYGGGTSVSATPSASAGSVDGVTTYYNAQGQVQSGVKSGTYSTVGLDLCAPPVLTDQLWSAGCDEDPSLSGAGAPPATAAGVGPALTVGGKALPVSNGRQVAALGSTLQCATGQWSGSPTYTYAWQSWAATEQVWAPVRGATTSTFKPTAAGGTYLCTVTATNAAGTAQASTMSVLIQGR